MITSGKVTVVIPSLPERATWLERAVRSVDRQSAPPAKIVIYIDHDRAGAHVARNRALAQVTSPWVAFLDDDDSFHRDHLETLIAGANKSGADLIGTYPESDPPGMQDALVCCYKGVPVRGPIHIPWGLEQLDHFDARRGERCSHCRHRRGSYIMMTNLVRRDLIETIGGFPEPGSMGDGFAGSHAEDYLFLLSLLDAGAQFHHVTGRRTWTYRGDSRRTHGRV